MKEKNYIKLVRDGVIEKILQKGEVASYWKATDAELRLRSAQKVVEEAKELLEAFEKSKGRASLLEEAGDLQEAFELFLRTHRISSDELMLAQIENRRKKGSFDGHWILHVLF